jgi:hypothetical protein
MPISLVCSNPACKKIFTRTPSEMKKSRCFYCSQTCAAIVNNKKYIKNPGITKVCAYCGKDFKSRKKYCSTPCQYKGAVFGKERFIKLIKDFYEENGRIPLKREMGHYHAARGIFGTWNKAIIAAGFAPNPVLFANKHVAKDGHICDSVAEMIVDDWLTKNRVDHKHHVYYPNQKRFKTDFLVNGKYWIEFFGLLGEHQKYDKLREEKLKMIKTNKLFLTEIYPSDLFPKNNLVQKLGFLFGGV